MNHAIQYCNQLSTVLLDKTKLYMYNFILFIFFIILQKLRKIKRGKIQRLSEVRIFNK